MIRLLRFFAITYAVTWVCFIALAAVRLPAATHQPLALLGAFAPGLVAIFLAWLDQGRPAVGALLRPILRARVSPRWYLFALFYMAAIKLIVALLSRIATGAWPRFGRDPWYVLLIATLFSTPFQAGEEVGWRGYALPRLAIRFGLPRASLVLGLIWACWHLPQFYIPQADTFHQSFPVYLLQVVALSVAFAWLWAHTRQSLLLPMLLHAAINNTKDIVPSAVTGATQPFTFHASLVGWLTTVLLWIAAAIFLRTMPKNLRLPEAHETRPLEPSAAD